MNDAPPDQGHHDPGRKDFLFRHLHDVPGKHDEIGALADRYRGDPEYFARVRAEAENKLKEIPVMAKGVSASKGIDKRWFTVAAAVGGVLLLLVTLGKSRKK